MGYSGSEMKRFLLMTGIAIGSVAGWLAFDPPAPREAGAFSAGPPAGKTGAPGEGTCVDCHLGHTVNPDAIGSVTITGAPVPYMPGQTYPLTVTVQRTGQSRWGFELTALKGDNTAAGTLANTTLVTRIVSLSGRSYVEQTTVNGVDGTFAFQQSGVWTFNWTAPAAGAGTVTFYAAGNAANGDFANSGDLIYTTNVSSMEGTPTDVSATTWGRIKQIYR